MDEAVATWKAQPQVAPLLEELQQYGAGEIWPACQRLGELIEDRSIAMAVVEPMVDALAGVLGQHTCAQVPFRHQYSDGVAMLQLAHAGSAVLILLAYDESCANAAPEVVPFSDVERHELVLAGAADLRIATLLSETNARAAIDCEPCRVVEGESLHLHANEARLVERVHGRLLMLRVARSPRIPAPSRSFSLRDGSLVHRASGDRRESRDEMAMAVLGRMGRIDAAPVFARLTREGSDHFRWQALRECLALDTATGFAALERLASDSADPLSGPAGALRAQLIETYPQLDSARTAEPCPA